MGVSQARRQVEYRAKQCRHGVKAEGFKIVDDITIISTLIFTISAFYKRCHTVVD